MLHALTAAVPVAVVAFCIWFGFHEYHKQQRSSRQ